MRNLILGATGQIGSLLIAQCEQSQDAVQGTWYRRPHAEHLPLDICDAESVHGVMRDFEPDVVYLAAGLGQVDYAEANPSECQAVNGQGLEFVLDALAKTSAKLVYFSSALVFGSCRTAHHEDSPVQPLSIYAQTLAENELRIRSHLPERHLILRTHMVYGPEERGRNIAMNAIRRLRNGQTIECAIDRQCQPTFGPDLANVAVELVKLGCNGTFHVVGPERMTEFAFMRTLAFVNGFDSDLVQPVPVEHLGEEAPRPKNLWLDCTKLRDRLGSKVLRKPSDALRWLRDRERSPVYAYVA